MFVSMNNKTSASVVMLHGIGNFALYNNPALLTGIS
jgi:hypothetical protein